MVYVWFSLIVFGYMDRTIIDVHTYEYEYQFMFLLVSCPASNEVYPWQKVEKEAWGLFAAL